MEFLNQIFSSEFIYSLGWTIIHSLWQGCIIFALMWLFLFVFRQFSSRLKYIISSLSLSSVFAAAVWTFIAYYDFYSIAESSSAGSITAGNAGNQIDQSIIFFQFLPDFALDNYSIIQEFMPFLFFAWLIGVLVLLVKYAGGYFFTRRIIKKYNIAPDYKWVELLNQISKKMNFKKAVRLIESKLVKIPLTIGFFKPVIIVPLGFFSGISPLQIEAIFAHELAHIVRKDYVVNLIQTAMEVIFFYNPFVWMISSHIRQERENCCDDQAVSLIGDRKTFVMALADVYAQNVGKTGHALTIVNNKKQLLKRIIRITQMKKENKIKESVVIIIVIFVISLLFVAILPFKIQAQDKYKQAKKIIKLTNEYNDFFIKQQKTNDLLLIAEKNKDEEKTLKLRKEYDRLSEKVNKINKSIPVHENQVLIKEIESKIETFESALNKNGTVDADNIKKEIKKLKEKQSALLDELVELGIYFRTFSDGKQYIPESQRKDKLKQSAKELNPYIRTSFNKSSNKQSEISSKINKLENLLKEAENNGDLEDAQKYIAKITKLKQGFSKVKYSEPPPLRPILIK